jgi:hypothetical protein
MHTRIRPTHRMRTASFNKRMHTTYGEPEVGDSSDVSLGLRTAGWEYTNPSEAETSQPVLSLQAACSALELVSAEPCVTVIRNEAQ